MPAAFFPSVFDDETIYSIYARLVLHANGSGEPSLDAHLFGRREARHVAVPSALSSLTLASKGVIPTHESTLRFRSLLGAYIPLLPEVRRRELLSACKLSSNSAASRAASGLNCSPESARLLKWCPRCVDESLARSHFTYWRTSHQYPGVWVCDLHFSILSHIEQNSRNVGWALPEYFAADAKLDVVSTENFLKLHRLYEVISWIVGKNALDTTVLQVMLRSRCRAAGFCRSEIKLRTDESKHLAALASAYFSDLPAVDVAWVNQRNWLSPLFKTAQYNPLPWAMAFAWIGATQRGNLEDEYSHAATRLPLAELFPPAILTPRLTRAPQALYDAFETCDLKTQILKEVTLTEYEITHWLRKDKALVAHWTYYKRARRLEHSLSTLKQVVQNHPHYGRLEIMSACALHFRWLRIHAPEALENALPPSRSPSTQVQLSFNWQ
ncbi:MULTISPECIES: TniQ family protein [Variovorax]|jgi:hypothetical protein|uniref:TniQ family protein n=1 Tax=Variovorax TaxID=34072 RepID=UPI000A5AD4DE|nr:MULTISPECIES: TniQ family protein [Variovorax]UKI08964.1 TniQ family protein [Variovorax paradoxus]